MEATLKRLGERIRGLRIARGFASQEAFADYCGMHRTFLGHLETGRKDFRLTTLIRVSDALGVSLSELFQGLEGNAAEAPNPKAPVSRRDRELIVRELEMVEGSIQRLRQLAGGKRGKDPGTTSKTHSSTSRGNAKRP